MTTEDQLDVSINSTSYKRSDKPRGATSLNIPSVSINSTSYKRSDQNLVNELLAGGMYCVSINSTSYKRSDLQYAPRKVLELLKFPLIPLLIKEAIC